MVRDGDVASASNYMAVQGVLRAVGKRLQVYVASEDLELVEPDLLKDLVATFDDRIFPVAAASVGLARDVDGDGRFTVLLSSWLNRLGNGRNAVDGFVRVSDLDLAYSAPFGNRCDMMYLRTNLKSGPHLRTVLSHEYMHAVVFSGKCGQASGLRPVVVEEEGWLDEALAHLAEDQQGFSRSNIDYRISAFLSQPERYQLVVEDYYAANLFRSHGNRGSTYLFLRWCVDHYGPELMPALIHSRLRGIANLEDATGCSFAELFRRWSVALFMSGLDPASKPEPRGAYRSVDIRNPLEDWELAGPRTTSVASGGPADCWPAAGTSSHFVVLRGGSSPAVEVTVSGPPEAQIQVTAVPLPAGMARLELAAKATRASDGDLRLRATISEQNQQPVRLTALAWEPLIPPADSQLQEFRHGQLDMLGIASTFGTSALRGGAELRSREIRLKGVHPGTGPLIVKLVGTDAEGRRVAAWREIQNLDHEDEANLIPPSPAPSTDRLPQIPNPTGIALPATTLGTCWSPSQPTCQSLLAPPPGRNNRSAGTNFLSNAAFFHSCAKHSPRSSRRMTELISAIRVTPDWRMNRWSRFPAQSATPRSFWSELSRALEQVVACRCARPGPHSLIRV